MKIMSINKINYEQFALDYLEGNLSGDALRDMELFLAENADIKKELEELELFYLEEENIIYADKKKLLKETAIIPLGIKNNSFSIRRTMGIAATLFLFVTLSVLFIFNNDISEEKRSIVNITNKKIKEIIQQNNEKTIIPNNIELPATNTGQLNHIAHGTKAIKNINQSQNINKKNEKKTTINHGSEDPITGSSFDNIGLAVKTNSNKRNSPVTTTADNDIITMTKQIQITRINTTHLTAIPSKPPSGKLMKIDIVSPYIDLENHSQKGILAKMEDAGLIPERQAREGKIRDAFVPEYFSSRN